MPGGYNKADVTCPFYRFDDGKQRIVCEGIITGSSVGLVYREKCDFSIQMNEFCCKKFANCEIHRMLMEAKYADDV